MIVGIIRYDCTFLSKGNPLQWQGVSVKVVCSVIILK